MTASASFLGSEENKHGYKLLAAPVCPFQSHPFMLSSISRPLPVPPPNVLFDKSAFSLCFSHSSIWLSTLCLTSPRDRTCDIAGWLRRYEHPDTQTHADTLHIHNGAELRGSAWRFTHVTVKTVDVFWQLLLPTNRSFDFLISDPLMAYNHRWADSRCWLIPDALLPRYHHWFYILFSFGTSLHWFILEFQFLLWLPGVKG